MTNRVLPPLPQEIWANILTNDVNIGMIKKACIGSPKPSSEGIVEGQTSAGIVNDSIPDSLINIYDSIRKELGEENFQALENWTREQEGSLPENIHERLYVLFNRVKKDAIASTSVDYVDSIIENPLFGECNRKTFLFFYYLSQSSTFNPLQKVLQSSYQIPPPNADTYQELETYLTNTFISKIKKDTLLHQLQSENIESEAFFDEINTLCKCILTKAISVQNQGIQKINAIDIPSLIEEKSLNSPIIKLLPEKTILMNILFDFYFDILRKYWNNFSSHYNVFSPLNIEVFKGSFPFPGLTIISQIIYPHTFAQKWFAFNKESLRALTLRSTIPSLPSQFVIPPQICNHSNLTHLALECFNINKIPPEITQLTQLRILELPFNNFSAFPPIIEKLENLEILDLFGNCTLSYKTLNDAFIRHYFSSCKFSYNGMEGLFLTGKFFSIARKINSLFITNIFLRWTLRPLIQVVYFTFIGMPYLLLYLLRYIIYNFVFIPIGTAFYALFWIGKKICIFTTSSDFYTRITSTVKNIFYRFARSFFSQKNSWKIFYPLKKLYLTSTIYLINDFKYYFKHDKGIREYLIALEMFFKILAIIGRRFA